MISYSSIENTPVPCHVEVIATCLWNKRVTQPNKSRSHVKIISLLFIIVSSFLYFTKFSLFIPFSQHHGQSVETRTTISTFERRMKPCGCLPNLRILRR